MQNFQSHYLKYKKTVAIVWVEGTIIYIFI